MIVHMNRLEIYVFHFENILHAVYLKDVFVYFNYLFLFIDLNLFPHFTKL